MSYRDDDAARAQRADVLINEIAELERKKVEQATNDQRLESARAELQSLQAVSLPPPPPEPQESRARTLFTHIGVFSLSALATFIGYTLLV